MDDFKNFGVYGLPTGEMSRDRYIQTMIKLLWSQSSWDMPTYLWYAKHTGVRNGIADWKEAAQEAMQRWLNGETLKGK